MLMNAFFPTKFGAFYCSNLYTTQTHHWSGFRQTFKWIFRGIWFFFGIFRIKRNSVVLLDSFFSCRNEWICWERWEWTLPSDYFTVAPFLIVRDWKPKEVENLVSWKCFPYKSHTTRLLNQNHEFLGKKFRCAEQRCSW